MAEEGRNYESNHKSYEIMWNLPPYILSCICGPLSNFHCSVLGQPLSSVFLGRVRQSWETHTVCGPPPSGKRVLCWRLHSADQSLQVSFKCGWEGDLGTWASLAVVETSGRPLVNGSPKHSVYPAHWSCPGRSVCPHDCSTKQSCHWAVDIEEGWLQVGCVEKGLPKTG